MKTLEATGPHRNTLKNVPVRHGLFRSFPGGPALCRSSIARRSIVTCTLLISYFTGRSWISIPARPSQSLTTPSTKLRSATSVNRWKPGITSEDCRCHTYVRREMLGRACLTSSGPAE